jgi:outer membrane protein
VLREALRRRPDLLTDVAKLRASDANIAAARSELLPKVSVGVTASVPYWANNVDNSPYFTVHQPQGAALLNLEWPLYDGGLLQNKLKLAESQRAEAADDLRVKPIEPCARSRSPTTKSRRGYSNTTPLLR